MSTTSHGSVSWIPRRDGRVVTARRFGFRDGPPILLLPAAPGSSALDPEPAVTTAAGVDLIVVDRPGYGGSTAWPPGFAPTWSAVADDHAAVLEELGVSDAHVVGWSNGGVGALALAAHHPHLVGAVTLVGTPAPHDEVPWVPGEFVDFLDSLRKEPTAAIGSLVPSLASMAEDVEAAVAGVAGGAADEALLKDRQMRARLVEMMREAFRTGASGLAADIVATNVAPWGFESESVGQPVDLVYGAGDEIISTAHGQYYHSRLPAASLRIVDGGHLCLISHWDDILRRRW